MTGQLEVVPWENNNRTKVITILYFFIQ
jgi:hypothetical protein